MENHRELMCSSLDEWFQENSEEHLKISVGSDTMLNYEKVRAVSLPSSEKGWMLIVNGTIGELKFGGEFRLVLERGLYKMYMTKLVTIDQNRKEEIARNAAKNVSIKSTQPNPDKVKQGAEQYSITRGGRTPVLQELNDFTRKLINCYDSKPGSIIDELCDNLVVPVGGDPTSILCGISSALANDSTISKQYSVYSEIELLVLRAYTQKPSDVDRDMGFSDVPMIDSNQVSAYESEFSNWMWSPSNAADKRNGSVYSAVCGTCRDQGPQGTKSEWSEISLRKWIKTICLITAMASTDKVSDKGLFRGLGGGGLPSSVVDFHRSLDENESLSWPAPSSTSFDERASREYMLGTAVNSVSKPNSDKPGTIMFNIRGGQGVQLQGISQYPNEAELLLPPLTMFSIKSVSEDASNDFNCGLNISMECLGPLGGLSIETPYLKSFLDRVRKDTKTASEVIRSSAKQLRCSLPNNDLKDINLVRVLKDQLTQSNSRSTDLTDELSKIRKQQTALESSNRSLQRKFEREQEEKKALLEAVQGDNEKAATKSIQTSKEIDQLHEKVNKLTAEIEERNNDVKNSEKKSEKYKNKKDEIVDKMEAEQQRLLRKETDLLQRISSLEKDQKELMTTCREYGDENTRWRSRYDELKAQEDKVIEKLTREKDNRIAELDQKSRDLEAHRRVDRATLENDATKIEKLTQLLDNKSSEFHQQKDRLELDKRNLKEELINVNNRLLDSEKAVEEYKAMKESEHTEACRYRRMSEKESITNQELRQKLEHQQRESTSEIERLQDRIQEELFTARKSVLEVTKLRELLQSSETSTREQSDKTDKLKTQLVRECEEHRGSITKRERTIQQLTESLQEASQEQKRSAFTHKNTLKINEAKYEALEAESKREITSLREEVSLQKKRLDQKSEEGKESIRRVTDDSLKQQQQLSDELRKTEGDLSQSRVALKHVEAQVTKSITEAKQMQKEFTQKSSDNHTLKKESDRLNDQLSELLAVNSSLEESNRSNLSELSRLRYAAEERERQKANIEKSVRQTTEMTARQNQKLRDELNQITQMFESEQKANNLLKEEASRLKSDRDSANRAADTTSYELTILKASAHRAASPQRNRTTDNSVGYTPSSPIAGGPQSPALARLESATRRLKREVGVIRSAMPTSPQRTRF